MSDVWFAIPTINVEKASVTFLKWRERGYRTAALIHFKSQAPSNCDCVIRPAEYHGWGWAINELSKTLVRSFGAEWVVGGGDDQYPDPAHHADNIAAECEEHFNGTFGVMQPSGDAYGALADKSAAVSPWLGKAWVLRANGGKGPLWDAYGHYYADTELAAVASKLGVMWWRDDLTQYHDHYLRHGQPTPEHLLKWQATVAPARVLFEQRRKARFPGSEPLKG